MLRERLSNRSNDKSFYDPQMGRFTQEDPVGDGLDWYEYVGSNPEVFIDVEGYYRHKPGGPIHNKPGERLSCKRTDSEDAIDRKIQRLIEIIDSHKKIHKGDKIKDLEDWMKALAKCRAEKQRKRERALVPAREPQRFRIAIPEVDWKKVGIGVGVIGVGVGVAVLAPEFIPVYAGLITKCATAY